MEHVNITRFLREAGKLKRTRRAGWVEAGVPDPESVADHCYRVALLAMLLSDQRGLDTLRAVRMALLHDLSEAVTGDLTPRQKAPSHGVEEMMAFDKLTGSLPQRLRRSYRAAMDEYTKGVTRESALVHAADRLEMVIQALEYEESGSVGLERFKDVSVPPEYAAIYEEMLGGPSRRMGQGRW